MKVYHKPNLADMKNEQSGMKQVILHYEKYMPEFGVEYVNNIERADLAAIHAGAKSVPKNMPLVAHLHGLYFTADYDQMSNWEWRANGDIIPNIRQASCVTVPSDWVAEIFQRDMRFTPYVIPHGIDAAEWEGTHEDKKYILWNKNRTGDVCGTKPLDELIKMFPKVQFVSTYAKEEKTNLFLTGTIDHLEMKKFIQQSTVYLSTTKETFGIGVLEAMASGVPVLGWRYGGNVDLIDHGVNGYLAEPDNYQDLANGLSYCWKYRDTLGANGREMVKHWDWMSACEKVYECYQDCLTKVYHGRDKYI